jgi:predicted PurR-regulated permease PerM
LAVVVAALTIAALYFARVILIPLTLAGLLAFVLTPLVHLLERARLGRVFSAVLVVSLGVAIVAGVGWTITRQSEAVLEELPNYQQNILNKIEFLRGARNRLLGGAMNALDEVWERLSTPADDGVLNPNAERLRRGTARKPPAEVRLADKPSLPLDSLQNLAGGLIGAGLVVIFTLFMIIRSQDLRNRFLSLVGTSHLHMATEAMDDAAARVSRYLRVQLMVNTGYGLGIGIGLHVIGLPRALLWGVIGGILRFVPYLGPPLGAIGPILLSVALFPGWHAAVFTLALYVGLEIAVAQFLEPLLYGERTGLSPVAVLVAAVFWTTLWGPLGLVLSTPLTACLLVLGRRVPRLEFLHKLLGDQPVLRPDAHFYQRLLATDSNEAREVLEGILKDHSLEEVYESVLIPALALAEQDRHNHVLDEFTERFVYENTRELVQEICESRHLEQNRQEASEARTGSAGKGAALHVACLPARDEADGIIAIMLTQLLERAGYRADAVSLRSTPEMLAEIDALQPDIVCLSALPPYAISHARLLYERLHAQRPDLKIIVGLWNFSGDLPLALSRIGMKEEGSILTSPSQVIRTVGLASEFSRHNAPVGI